MFNSLLLSSWAAWLAAKWPPWWAWALGLPGGIAWSYLCLRLAAWLKHERGWRTGYTRKVFHFLIFGSVAAIQIAGSAPGVYVFGTAVSLVVFFAVIRGAGDPLYEALAREKDAPHRTRYVLAPYCATLLGGLASDACFGCFALFGYLVAGLGDAIGEPVGTRWGRHVYRVPAQSGLVAIRSWEGSLAVFIVSTLAFTLALRVLPEASAPAGFQYLLIPALGAVCALVEARSPHGWDNATLQFIPAWLAWWLLHGNQIS